MLYHIDNCYITERNGKVIYTGNVNRTDNGLPCGRWDRIGLKYPLGPEHVNYCRNPDHDPKGLWCYLQWNSEWRYCNIPRCGKYIYTVLGNEPTPRKYINFLSWWLYHKHIALDI